MIAENFITSNFKKFETLFLGKELLFSIVLSDEEDEEINNVIYLKLENDDYIGIFMNGANPFFSKSYVEDIDLFNLYENYDELNINKNQDLSLKIDVMRLVFNSDYNELAGFYFSDKSNEKSFSILFMGDEFQFHENISVEEFDINLSTNLSHITNKSVYLKDNQNKEWLRL
jgi:hypothetical protein